MALKLDFSKVLVKDNTNRTTKAESDILQQAELIMARVTIETFNAMANTVANHTASLSIQAQQIALRVASTDFNGATIASLINQSAAEVKIQASKITLEGLITANGNFRVLADGSIEAKNTVLSGSITATRMVSPPGTRPDGSTYSGLDYYGEIGISDGAVGLGLFDTRYDTGPYMRILETGEGTGFILVDTNNISRFSAQSTKTNMSDRNGANGLILSDAARHMVSPDGNTYVVITNGVIQVVVNGVVKASW